MGDDDVCRRARPRVRRRSVRTRTSRGGCTRPLPADMPYVCFYPMTKRREAGQNWYTLSLDERSRLMQAHGQTGRRYAGRVLQIITGAIGFDAWEWGVTLFAKDPLDFKKLVTDMRFDEVSAKYAEFGEFFVGKLAAAERAREPARHLTDGHRPRRTGSVTLPEAGRQCGRRSNGCCCASRRSAGSSSSAGSAC